MGDLATALTPPKNVRLVDQNGNEFDPKDAEGKSAVVSSGFYGCPVCEKIKLTIGAAAKELDGVRYIVINQYPERDNNEKTIEELKKSYEKAGIDLDNLTILFAQERKGGKWVNSNAQTNDIENSVMNELTPGHSANIFVFDANGSRIGRSGTYGAKNTQEDREKNAQKIIDEVKKAQQNNARSQVDKIPTDLLGIRISDPEATPTLNHLAKRDGQFKMQA